MILDKQTLTNEPLIEMKVVYIHSSKLYKLNKWICYMKGESLLEFISKLGYGQKHIIVLSIGDN